MIRNLKKLGDDEKKIMALKEQLALSIKNDEAVSAARGNFQAGVPLEIPEADRKTLAEKITDEDKQRMDAQGHLLELFKTPEVLSILSMLTKDQIISLNTLWSGIKKELEKVNTKSLVPQDFITFLNRYIDSAVSLQGALNVGINSPEELKEIIPDPSTIIKLKTFLVSRPKTAYLTAIVDELAPLLPTAQDYNTIFRQPALSIKKDIDYMANAYPNKNLLEKALDEGSVTKIEKLLQGLTPAKLQDIELKIGGIRSAGGVKIKLNSPQAQQIFLDFENAISVLNRRFYQGLTSAQQYVISKRRKDPRYPFKTQQEIDLWDDFSRYNYNMVTDVLQTYSPVEQDVIMRTLKPGQIVGKGISMGRGRPSLPSEKPKAAKKIKIGEGIKVQPRPANAEFGKYIINRRQLDKQVLNLKTKSGGAISWFTPQPISDSFCELLNDMLAGNGLNKHLLKTLDPDEQKVFYQVCDKAGILQEYKMTKPVDKEEEEQMKKFQILLGEFQSGNNSPTLISQLRKYIIHFTNLGKIPKAKSLSMLMSLS